jgi:hypothetical protein
LGLVSLALYLCLVWVEGEGEGEEDHLNPPVLLLETPAAARPSRKDGFNATLQF